MARRSGPEPERPTFRGGRKFGAGRSIAGTIALLVALAVVAFLLLIADRPDLAAGAVVLMPLFGVLLAVEVIVWARRRMDQPMPQGVVTCYVCGNQKPRGLRVLMDDELALDAWWRACPRCHVRYCDKHKGLMWLPDEGMPPLHCLACGYEWRITVPRGNV